MDARSQVMADELDDTQLRRGRPGSWLGRLWQDKARLRRVLMIFGVVVVAAGALVTYLIGGRFVSTDDSYVRAAKLMVTTDVSGVVKTVDVKQGQQVKKGQVLFTLDPRPFAIAVANTQAALEAARQNVLADEDTYQGLEAQVAAQEAQVRLAQSTFNRYLALAKSNAIAPQSLDQARSTEASARATLASLRQNAANQLSKLLGDPRLPPERSPAFMQAQAAYDEALRQLAHATVRAPFDGEVTEVDSLQPGTLVISALSSFTTTSAIGLVSTTDLWIEADMKETDLTYVSVGNPVSVTVDTYPGRNWDCRVGAISRASASTFAALSSESSSSNWVKVVQRIPVRIVCRIGPNDPQLRAGMSAVVEIDTGLRRWSRLLAGH
jgi:membrane fusion protein, multidrug efflux system